MSDIVIKVENLSKRYRIGASTGGYRTLRESLSNFLSAPFRRVLSRANCTPKYSSSSTLTLASASSRNDEIWALKDVSFEVEHGEVVGIIGRNGAGKSTLLKILSRITEPTRGYAEILGRVGSLLEVGTGFHYELTGRENIYLGGAILGMKRLEIGRRFDEIVSFAEVEKFIDTPVKHYSSGMYMRLAFAVAAHLDPEILLVDEVLAVGDASFQKKCLGKMEDVAKQGRTVLFVSHNMAAVSSLCSRGILLREGLIFHTGDVRAVISKYLQLETSNARAIFKTDPEKPMQILEVRTMNEQGILKSSFSAYEPVIIEIDYLIRTAQVGATVACIIVSPLHGHLFSTGDWDTQPQLLDHRSPGVYTAKIKIPCPFLNSGTYTIAVGMGIPPHSRYDRRECVSITVHDDSGEIYDVGSGKRHGALLMNIPWEIRQQKA